MKRNIVDLEDELGDWHATFPNKDAQQVLRLWREDVAERETLIEKLRKERDAALKCCAEAETECERLRLLVPTTAQAMAYQSLLLKYEAAEKACAEMRMVIKLLLNSWARGEEMKLYDAHKDAEHALSTDCGKDFIHRDEVKPLVEAAQAALDWFETGPADFTKAAEEVAPKLETALAHCRKEEK